MFEIWMPKLFPVCSEWSQCIIVGSVKIACQRLPTKQTIILRKKYLFWVSNLRLGFSNFIFLEVKFELNCFSHEQTKKERNICRQQNALTRPSWCEKVELE